MKLKDMRNTWVSNNTYLMYSIWKEDLSVDNKPLLKSSVRRAWNLQSTANVGLLLSKWGQQSSFAKEFSVFRWHFFLSLMENYSSDLQAAKGTHQLCYRGWRKQLDYFPCYTLFTFVMSQVYYIDHQGNAIFKERQGRSDVFTNIRDPS